MHFGLASIKHRTNSFKVVVNIFFSVFIIFLFAFLICTRQILGISPLKTSLDTGSSIVALNPHCFFSSSLVPQLLLVPALGNHDCFVRAFLTSKCLSEQVILYNYVGCYNSPLLFRELYTIFLSIDPLGDAQFSCCISEMKASLYQDDRSELELQNQDIHDHCVRTESRHDELSSVQVRMSGL